MLFLPHYFRGEMYTAYELMRLRFGERIRRLTAGLFLVLRALAEGVRVFAISIVVAIVLDTGELASILLIVALTLFYTFEGGMTAVIWTDVVQMFLYVVGAVLSFFVILQHIPGGWPQVVEVASAAGQIPALRLLAGSAGRVFFPDLQFLGRNHRRLLSHHGQPRHRAASCPTPAGGTQSVGQQEGPVGKLAGHLLPVRAVPADRRLSSSSTMGRPDNPSRSR